MCLLATMRNARRALPHHCQCPPTPTWLSTRATPGTCPATSPIASSALAVVGGARDEHVPAVGGHAHVGRPRPRVGRERRPDDAAQQQVVQRLLRLRGVGWNRARRVIATMVSAAPSDAHAIDADDHVVERGVLPVHAVQEPGPLHELRVQRLDVLRGFLLAHPEVVHRRAHAVLLARDHAHAQHVRDAAEQQMARVPVVDEVPAAGALEQRRAHEVQVRRDPARRLLPEARGILQRRHEDALVHARGLRRVAHHLAADARDAEPLGDGLRHGHAAREGPSGDGDDGHVSPSLLARRRRRGGAPQAGRPAC